MATPKELVHAVARTSGVSEATVIVHDRNLLMAGLRTEGQRGRGKSEVTFRDAAHLLMAVAASRNVKDSAEVALTYGKLVADRNIEIKHTVDNGQDTESLADALTYLLEELPRLLDSGIRLPGRSVVVRLYSMQPGATITWDIHGSKGTSNYKMERIYEGTEPYQFADLKFTSEFTNHTIERVGSVVSGRWQRLLDAT